MQAERTRVINRLKGLLTTAGVRLRLDATFCARLATGAPVGRHAAAGGVAGAVTAELGASWSF